MPTDTQRIQDVFLAASEIRDPAERARFLDVACEGDIGLKSRVVALLRAHDQPDSLLDQPVAAASDSNKAVTGTIGQESGTPRSRPRDTYSDFFDRPLARTRSAGSDSLGRIGHYEVLQVLGQGRLRDRVPGIRRGAPQGRRGQGIVAADGFKPRRRASGSCAKPGRRHRCGTRTWCRYTRSGSCRCRTSRWNSYPAKRSSSGSTGSGRSMFPRWCGSAGRSPRGWPPHIANDLIHRDIKPGNVLLEGGAQRVKITDFGLARAADDASISQSGIIAGTPMYMAPEQAKG